MCGGKQVFLKGKLKGGYYISPTVISGLDYLCRLNQEEVFGPVVSIIPSKTKKMLLKWLIQPSMVCQLACLQKTCLKPIKVFGKNKLWGYLE